MFTLIFEDTMDTDNWKQVLKAGGRDALFTGGGYCKQNYDEFIEKGYFHRSSE